MSMVSTDPIADMLTRIRNAVAVRKNEIALPHSKVKQAVADILKANNFVSNVTVSEATIGRTLHVTIAGPDQNARITEIKRLSKPGRRMYAAADEIPKIKQGRGLVIISTSQGLMTGKEAGTKHLGGELICKVY